MSSPAPTADPLGIALVKIRPPRQRSGLIDRPALLARLREDIGRQRLVLVSAPAGFGKTAILSQLWHADSPERASAWIACDEDDDVQRLLACTVAALEAFDLPWRVAPDALGALAQQPAGPRRIAEALVDALAAAEVASGLIVFDDTHRIDNPAVFEWLEALIEALPERWTVLIAARVDPPLPLARWRARGELDELRQADLCFTPDEVRALVDLRARADDAELAAQLHARTQGWAAGLGLLINARGQRGGAATPMDPRHLFDYLATEVLGGMPAELRRFLLRSAVLSELSAGRCAQVTGDADAARHLEAIEQRGLFVNVLDSSEAAPGEYTLRLHDLFREGLEAQLRRECPDELPDLLRRAAATEGDPVRRIGYLTRAAAWDEAEAQLAQLGPALVARGAVPQVLRLIDTFPPERREASPRLAHLRGIAAWAHWDIVRMCRSLEQAAQGHDAAGHAEAAQRARALMVLGLTAGGQVRQAHALMGQLRQRPLDAYSEITAAQVESWFALSMNRLDAVAPPLAHMVERLEAVDDPMLWFQCVPLTLFYGLPGTHAPIRRFIAGALARTPDDPPTPLRVLAASLQAGLDLWAGELEAARDRLRQVADDCRWLNCPPNVSGYHDLFASFTLALLGDREAALAASQNHMDGLDDQRTSGRRAIWIGHFRYAKLRIAAIADDDATLRDIAAQLAAQPNPDENAIFLRERACLPARLAEADGDWASAAEGYRAALDDEMGLDLYGQALEVRVRLAHAWLRLGRLDDAAQALRAAFERVEARGDLGAALFAGRRALAALAGAAWGLRLDAVQQARLRDWSRRVGSTSPAAATPAAVPSPTTGDPADAADGAPCQPSSLEILLSEREREVLAHLAAGDSNKLIARALDLSPHTVKRHVANILDKLGARSRGQAAAMARSGH